MNESFNVLFFKKETRNYREKYSIEKEIKKIVFTNYLFSKF